ARAYPPDAFIALGKKLAEAGQAAFGHQVADEILARCAQDPDRNWFACLLKASLYYQGADGPNVLDSLCGAIQMMRARGNTLGIGMALRWAAETCTLAEARLLSALFNQIASDLYLKTREMG